MPWFLIFNMEIATEVARVEGAMLAYGWKSRWGPYPDGYTEEFYRFSDSLFNPTLPEIIKQTRAEVKRKRREITKKLRECI
jgi:hypothetical protein